MSSNLPRNSRYFIEMVSFRGFNETPPNGFGGFNEGAEVDLSVSVITQSGFGDFNETAGSKIS
jgi:hypothetical protein